MTDWADEIASELFIRDTVGARAIAAAFRKVRSDALEEAAKLVSSKWSYDACPRGQTDPSTGAFECLKEARGECNCYEFSEAVEAIEALKRPQTKEAK